MGKKGSMLVPFLKEALKGGKYGSTIVNVDEGKGIFAFTLARKSDFLDAGSLKMLEDWNNIKGRKFSCESNYSVAKQALLMSLKRSVYLEFVARQGKYIAYRFLSDVEIKVKKKNSKIKPLSLGRCSDSDSPPSDPPSSRSISTEFSDKPFECLFGSEISESPIPFVEDCDTSVIESDREVQLHILETGYETNTDNHSKQDSENRWKEVESYLFEETVDCVSRSKALRSKEVQLFHYKCELLIDNKVWIICERENENRGLCSDDVFLDGYPGVLADADLLQRLLSCHADVTRIRNDHLLLILTPSSEPDCYVMRQSSNCLILRSLWFFIATGMRDYEDNGVKLNTKITKK